MKFKLIFAAILIVCLLSAVSAGLLSVHRSEGAFLSPEDREKIEAIVQQFTNEQASE